MKSKKLISIVLTMCLLVSMLSVSAFSSSAEEDLLSLDNYSKFAVGQLFSRGLSAAGTVVSKIGELTNNDEVKEVTSFINKWVFGGSDTGAKLSAIQKTCDEILVTATDIKDITSDVQSLQNAEIIKNAASDYDDAWLEQVESVLKENDLNNIFEKYTDYLAYANGNKKLPAGKTVEDYKNIYVQSLMDVCAKHGYPRYDNSYGDSNEYYKKMMYTTDVIDVLICDGLEDLLDCMENRELYGDRFVDKAALYAYYAYPFSSEQAAFVDAAAKHQINKITLVLMIYQDFMAQRAEYYTELNAKGVKGYETTEQCDAYYKSYSGRFDRIANEFMDDIAEFFQSEIILDDGFIYATTTFEKYLRDDSASTKANNNQSFKLKCNTNYNSKITQTPSFYKNASVSISGSELVFTPFYVLNGNAHSGDVTKFTTFNTYKETVYPSLYGQSVVHRAYSFNNNYNCLKDGVYSDGNNNYVSVSNVDQFKGLINTTAYSAYKYTPFTYFGDYLGYGKNDSLYLFLRANTEKYTGPYYSGHKLPVYNVKNAKTYSETWNSETLAQTDVKNEKYAVILTPQSNNLKTTVNSQVKGGGSVSINGKAEGAFASGSTVDVEINVPENYVITSVKVLYHGDMSNPSKVTSEKVISEGIDSNSFELSYGVPYTNVTIAVETLEVPGALNTDAKGNYVVNDYYDLCQMADMVNSGYSKYVNGDYILKGNANCRFIEWIPIGTEDVQFNGTFDGNGYIISGLNANLGVADGSRHPMFNVLGEEAVVENVYFSEADVFSAETPVKGSGVVCKQNNGIIRDCMISDSSVQLGNWHYLGGVAGLNNGTIENCGVVNTSITRRWGASDTGAMGGITETNNGTVKNCFTYNCTFENGDASKNAPVVSSGNAPENCYFLTNSDVNKTFGTEKSMGKFENGEVTYLLNNGVTDGTQSFYQYLGGNFYPMLFSVESLTTVYKTESGTYTNNK